MVARGKQTPEEAGLAKLQSHHVSLDALRKAIPPQCFVPSLERSIRWLVFDFANVLVAMYAHFTFAQSETFRASTAVQVVSNVFFWAWGGFFMWSMFVVGHDCGHGTFSKYPLVNHCFGLLTHGFISVPYFPWRLSHFRHHTFHNHVTKDYSHPWTVGEPVHSAKRWIIPFVGWQMYLLGFYDGCHWLPIPAGRLFGECSTKEVLQGLLSTAVVAAYWALLFTGLGSWGNFAFFYLMPLAVFSWWIWTVTYLQHHADDTCVFDDSTWTYGYGAFETVDRHYGKGVEFFTHHITDCHIVHHLFFNKIPHYHLREASTALETYCTKHHPGLYRKVSTPDFYFEVFTLFWRKTFEATLVSKKAN